MTEQDKKTKPQSTSTMGAVLAGASALFHVKTGQTPEQFAEGMWDKAKSLTIDPVTHIYGPSGMLDRAAHKAVDKLQGIERPDTYYVSKDEHAAYLPSILAVAAALFPGLGELAPRVPGGSMVTPEGAIVRAPTAEAVKAAETAATDTAKGATLLSEARTGQQARPTEAGKPGERGKPAEAGKPPEAGKQAEGGKPTGRWTNDLTAGENMSTNAGRYQEQVSGRSADQTYHLDGRSFDGHEVGVNGKPDTLVEAKYLEDNGRFAKAYENMKQGNFSDFEHLYDRATSMLDQAKAQVSAAEGTGMQIEWRVSGEKATEALKTLFDNDPVLQGKINVEHVPSRPESVPAGAPKVDQAPVGAPKPPEQAPASVPTKPDSAAAAPKPDKPQAPMVKPDIPPPPKLEPPPPRTDRPASKG